MLTDFLDDITDPQDCPDCVTAGDICPYHQGWADGWDTLASTLGVLASDHARPVEVWP